MRYRGEYRCSHHPRQGSLEMNLGRHSGDTPKRRKPRFAIAVIENEPREALKKHSGDLGRHGGDTQETRRSHSGDTLENRKARSSIGVAENEPRETRKRHSGDTLASGKPRSSIGVTENEPRERFRKHAKTFRRQSGEPKATILDRGH